MDSYQLNAVFWLILFTFTLLINICLLFVLFYYRRNSRTIDKCLLILIINYIAVLIFLLLLKSFVSVKSINFTENGCRVFTFFYLAAQIFEVFIICTIFLDRMMFYRTRIKIIAGLLRNFLIFGVQILISAILAAWPLFKKIKNEEYKNKDYICPIPLRDLTTEYFTVITLLISCIAVFCLACIIEMKLVLISKNNDIRDDGQSNPIRNSIDNLELLTNEFYVLCSIFMIFFIFLVLPLWVRENFSPIRLILLSLFFRRLPRFSVNRRQTIN